MSKPAWAPPESAENDEELISKAEHFSEILFLRAKMETCKSYKTRVAEVSRRSELCSTGKRTFEVRCRHKALAGFAKLMRWSIITMAHYNDDPLSR